MDEIGATLFTLDEVEQLMTAMEWVIPSDSSPGAGSEECAMHLIDLILSLDPSISKRYKTYLPQLTKADLDDSSNRFAKEFVDHVRDCYYGYSDTGAWEDIGFRVTG